MKTGTFVGRVETSVRTAIILTDVYCGLLQSLRVDSRISRAQLKCDGTRAETRFRLSAKRTSLFQSVGGVSSVDYWQPRCAHQR